MTTLSAREIFTREYGSESRNPFTEHRIRLGKINRTTAYELSSGKGIFTGMTMYGVTIVEYDPSTDTTKRSKASKAFHSLVLAEGYIEDLQGV